MATEGTSNVDVELQQHERSIDYKEQINDQIGICRDRLNNAIRLVEINQAMETIETLKSMLVYWVEKDEAYKKEWTDAQAGYETNYKKLDASHREDQELTMKKQLARKSFEILLKLATKKGFTVIKTSKALLGKKINSEVPFAGQDTITEGDDEI